MEEITILARTRLTIQFREEMVEWLRQFPQTVGVIRDNGDAFLIEHGNSWTQVFDRVVGEEVQEYFKRLGVSQQQLPFIQHGDTYRGSWIFDAVIAMMGTATTVYIVLKSISELPEIADGLSELQRRIFERLKPQLELEVSQRIYTTIGNVIELNPSTQSVLPPPKSLVVIDFVIDSEQLRLLDKYCKNCGSQFRVGAKFCGKCGLSLDSIGNETTPNYGICIARCEKSKQLVRITFQSYKPGWWVATDTAAITKLPSQLPEQFKLAGHIELHGNYPGCPHCRAYGIAQCSSCTKLLCYDGNSIYNVCPWCNVQNRTQTSSHFTFDVQSDI